MSRLRPLYGSRPLADWVRAGGRPARRVPAHSLRLAWHAHWFEHNWRTASARLAACPLPDDPVFILGFWRSGTTVLHELLAAATGWTTPRTWQCFNPSTCFLMGPPARETAVERPMDRGRIATFGPQEDELALLLLGEPSLYRAFIDPRRLAECARHAKAESQATTATATATATAAPSELPRWQMFLRGIASVPAAPSVPAALPAPAPPSARLLLKSPNHTLRLPLLRATFPRARFIWIGRDSGEVLASNVRMWRTMMERYALWTMPPGELEPFLLELLGACARALERCLDELTREQLLWIDFAGLTAQPRPVLETVLRFLARDASPGSALREPGGIERRVAHALEAIPIHAGARAEPPIDARAQVFERAMSAARRHFGPGLEGG
ncbi:MAG: sulfotransferase [Steroidobacteraceae bacterium]